MPAGRIAAFGFALAASVALFVMLLAAPAAGGGTASAQTGGPVVVRETAVPEDWPAGQASDIITTFEAYSRDGGALSFALRRTSDAAKFALEDAGSDARGNYVAHLRLKAGEALDYETQALYLIGVVVSTESGGTAEMLLRLRVTDVDEVVPPPPMDPCFEGIGGSVNIVREWDAACLSANRPRDEAPGDYYARFFTFALAEPASVSIALSSEVDTYLYLMRGAGRDGAVVARNDDVADYTDLNSAIRDEALGAGEYTIEATSYYVEQAGNFRLAVSGLPGSGGVPAGCATGGAVPGAAGDAALEADCEALLGMRDRLAGTALLNWSAGLPIEDWDGVTVGGAPKRVTGLSLDGRGLNGEIPAGLARLSGLETLSLSGNGLRGSIPAEIGGLSGLTGLSLDGNRLTGAIPGELGNIAGLRTLSLGGNGLSGAIPAELGGLAELRSLLLANNRLTGAIPVELGRLSKLGALKLAGNGLSGCIPPALRHVADNDLSALDITFCAYGVCATGGAVADPDGNVGLVADCNALLAAKDTLAGNARLNWSAALPIESWEGVNVGGSPKRVVHLALNQRGLTGRLPAELGKLSHLSLLQLSANELRGRIPAELGRLSRLEILILADNELSGEIPAALDGLASVSHLSLSGNNLTGKIPPELSSLGKLGSLYIDDNELSGVIPGELGSLPKLRFLNLDDNELSGAIPSELGDSRTLEELSIDGNRLTGAIPAELGAITSLKTLSLEGNGLTGAIPAELGSLTNLEVLLLAANRLTGEIPAQLGAIPNLRRLSVHSNEFTGCIPKELADVARNDLISLGLKFCGEGQCAGGTAVANPNANHGLVSDCNELLDARDRLMGSGDATLNWSTELAIGSWDGVVVSGSPRRVTGLELSSKQLSGVIPADIGNITHLKTLDLSNNALTGEIPSELARLSRLESLSLDRNSLSGQIPYDLERLGNLKELYLSGNSLLTGCIPDGLEDVDKNDFTALGLLFCDKVDCSNEAAKYGGTGLVSDCETLIGLRDELAGGAFLNWSVHRAISEWEGVTVSGSTKRVTKIELKNEGLDGVIPAELGDLTGLEELALSGNALRGQIPSELAKLTDLRKLLLDGNRLSGEISPDLAVLKLVELKLAGNSLTGCVPAAFEDVATNDLSALGLEYCAVGACSSGTAVEDPDDHPGLVVDCDTLLTALDTLQVVRALNWSVDVPIQQWHGVTVEGAPKRVTQLRLGLFRLDGSIAPELGRLSKLKRLSLNDGRLSGTIPPELGKLTELETLSLSKNRLSGAIPSELGNLTALTHLSLYDNDLNGAIPSELGNLTSLTHLSLFDNDLSGAIPPELGKLTKLRELRLSHNQFSGGIPAELSSLSNLRHLHLRSNRLSGEIPPGLGGLADLRYLHLSDNVLSGEIPVELGSLSNLTQLYLSRNELSGGIPSELGRLSNLAQLYLNGNKLSGAIPVELGGLENLTHLYVGGNQLTGCVPAGLSGVQYNDLSLLGLRDCN